MMIKWDDAAKKLSLEPSVVFVASFLSKAYEHRRYS